MSVFNALHISSSALTAQRLRMDVASANIANADSTRGSVNELGELEPYRRKMVHMTPKEGNFNSFLHKAKHGTSKLNGGVKVSGIVQDTAPNKMVFEPNHPDANDDGFVAFPNVDPLKEMVDLMGASRSYEANITSLNASKDMLLKTLEIGK